MVAEVAGYELPHANKMPVLWMSYIPFNKWWVVNRYNSQDYN